MFGREERTITENILLMKSISLQSLDCELCSSSVETRDHMFSNASFAKGGGLLAWID